MLRNTKKTHEEFLKEIKDSNLECLTKYNGANQSIIMLCKECGYTFNTTPHRLLTKDGWCAVCSGKYSNDYFFKRKLRLINSTIEPLEEYINNLKHIKCKCKLCSYEFKSKPVNLIQGYGCKLCGFKSASEKRTKDTKQFNRELKKVNPYVKMIDEYTGVYNKVLCECKLCNQQWMVVPHNLLYGSGCPVCNMSRGEKIIIDILQKNNIQFEYLYRVNINNRIHIFDFYIPDKNIYIEYDGIQHYKPTRFTRTIDKYLEFNDRVKRDGEKDMWCFINGYELIRIPYTMSDENIEKIIGEL